MLKTKTAVLFAGRVDAVGAGDVVVVAVLVDVIVVDVVDRRSRASRNTGGDAFCCRESVFPDSAA